LRPESIRLSANDSGFLRGVLRFVVGYEPYLVAFAAEMGLAPAEVQKAAVALGAMEAA
jgi:hypothetical protein